MNNFLSKLVERKISEAVQKGQLNDLPGQGKPLEYGDRNIPSPLRSKYKMLKSAGVLPEALELRKEIATLTESIDKCTNKNEQILLEKKLSEKKIHLDILIQKQRNT